MVKGMDNRTLYIHDNLDILRGMNSESIDLIATDPPFNKGRDFHATPDSLAAGARFQDRWSWEQDVHPDWVDSIKDDQPALYELIDFVVAGLGNDSKTRRKNGGREDLAAFLCWLGVRVIEMRRVLKPTGSLYLHCDPTASHYIKAMLDGIFGHQQFRNEIIWERSRGRTSGNHWGNTTDSIFYYSKSNNRVWKDTLKPSHLAVFGTTADALKQQYPDATFVQHIREATNALAKATAFPVQDEIRRMHESLAAFQARLNAKTTKVSLTGAGKRNGESGKNWRGYNPTDKGRHWAVPKNGRFADWIDANAIAGYKSIENPHDRLDALDEAGLIHWSDNGTPTAIRPAEADAGVKVNNLWYDINRLSGTDAEKVGYPTQKPVDLYKRIIAASSNEGDLVLDPFCGCATTLIAAETLNRNWIGIDLWEHAATTLQQRIGFPVHARREPPVRTDDEADAGVSLPSINRRQRRAEPWMRLSHADMRDILYAAQDGVCAGCGRKLHIRFMQLDHMQPRADGGANTIDNRVMLCSPCNGAKGAILTISGLVRVNKRDGWLEDEGRRKIAYARARLVGEAAGENESEALIRLIGELPIDVERKAALERLLAPPRELAFGV